MEKEMLGKLFDWRTRLHHALENYSDLETPAGLNPQGRRVVSDVCYEIEDAFDKAGGRTELFKREK